MFLYVCVFVFCTLYFAFLYLVLFRIFVFYVFVILWVFFFLGGGCIFVFGGSVYDVSQHANTPLLGGGGGGGVVTPGPS